MFMSESFTWDNLRFNSPDNVSIDSKAVSDIVVSVLQLMFLVLICCEELYKQEWPRRHLDQEIDLIRSR